MAAPTLNVTPPFDRIRRGGKSILVDSAGHGVMNDLGAGVLHADSSGVLTSSTIVNADVSASAAIPYSKLNLAGSIVSADITDGTIVNADVNAAAAIAASKIATGVFGGSGATTLPGLLRLAGVTSGQITQVAVASLVHNASVTLISGSVRSIICLFETVAYGGVAIITVPITVPGTAVYAQLNSSKTWGVAASADGSHQINVYFDGANVVLQNRADATIGCDAFVIRVG